MLLYDAPASNPYVVRLFILERGGLELDVQSIDIMALENRKPPFRTEVNPRGEVPALRIDDAFVLTEITATCEYLDESPKAASLCSAKRLCNALRRPLIAWFRNDPATIDFYKGNRIPTPEARVNQKVVINQFLNLLDEELEGKAWLCGNRFSAADVHFYGLMSMMIEQVAPWVLLPTRKNVVAYFKRMDERETSKLAKQPFQSRVTV